MILYLSKLRYSFQAFVSESRIFPIRQCKKEKCEMIKMEKSAVEFNAYLKMTLALSMNTFVLYNIGNAV